MGIILGVSAVITMVSIGEGSKREALDQLERLGARNIIVRSQKPPETQAGGGNRSWSSKFGITRDDFEVIQTNFRNAEFIVPLKSVGSQMLKDERRLTSQAFGVTPDLARIINLRVSRGRYLSQADMDDNATVAVIGREVASKLFPSATAGHLVRIDDRVHDHRRARGGGPLGRGRRRITVGRDLNLDHPHSTATGLRDLVSSIVRFAAGQRGPDRGDLHRLARA